MARRRRNGLTDEDKALWSQVTRSATPMHPGKAVHPQPKQPAPKPVPRPVHPAPAIPTDFRVGSTAPAPYRVSDTAPTPAQQLAAQPVRMDAKTHRRLSRGKLAPESRIDLHGMTLAVAKGALTGFILSAHSAGRRMVLVITGKGKGDHGPLPTRSGALRHEVPHWLHMPPLAGVVLQIVPAHLRHGGGGAYYVYLRRAR